MQILCIVVIQNPPLRYIPNMSEENAGQYRAKVTYGTLTLDLDATVTHLKFLELTTSIPLPVEFNTYYITCRFSGITGAAVPTITWFKDNKPVFIHCLHLPIVV